MAAGTYSVLTNSSVNAIWRKAQGDLVEGINYDCEEWDMAEDFGKELKIAPSLRSMEFPVDMVEGAGIASISEGGKEAYPSSPNAIDATVNFIHLNGRFTVSKLAHWAGSADGGAAEIKKQIVFQGMHKIRDMKRYFSDASYGFSTGYLCQTSTNATQSSGTYTLKNAYGLSSIAGTTTAQKNYICAMFKVGDRVALVRSDALVPNAIGTITAVTPATPSIAVTWNGSVDSDDGDYVVKANSLENTTIAGTDFNRGLVGDLDMLTSTSVHNISGSTYPNWTAALADTDGGRFSTPRFLKGLDEIANYGGGKVNLIKMDQGVYRDMVALQSAGLRFNSAFSMEIDGDIKAGGRKIFRSRRVPPGFVILQDKSSLRRKSLLRKPAEGPAWGDGKELIDDSGFIFAIDWPVLRATTNRKNMAYYSGLTTQ